jgi:putative SOS response-associated peptidase YedK
MSTNNARSNGKEGEPEKYTFKGPWWRSQRCLVVAEEYDEPCHALSEKNIWLRPPGL